MLILLTGILYVLGAANHWALLDAYETALTLQAQAEGQKDVVSIRLPKSERVIQCVAWPVYATLVLLASLGDRDE